MLWDFLPGGTFPGGAPFNVGYHLHCHDLAVHVASAIGRDELGNELLRRLQVWGLGTSGVAVHPDLPTGSVRARLSAGGDAHYEIATGVAWDRIAAEGSLAATTRADALVFGSLAQRTPFNRTSLQHLLAALPPTALRVFDVNFRPPHDDLPLIRRLATQATLLKLNDGEAARLCAGNPAASDVESHARFLATETGCVRVVITAAARGAGLLGRDGRSQSPTPWVRATRSWQRCFRVCCAAGTMPRPSLTRAASVSGSPRNAARHQTTRPEHPHRNSGGRRLTRVTDLRAADGGRSPRRPCGGTAARRRGKPAPHPPPA